MPSEGKGREFESRQVRQFFWLNEGGQMRDKMCLIDNFINAAGVQASQQRQYVGKAKLDELAYKSREPPRKNKRQIGLSPSGKATVFDTVIRWFESSQPSQT